jgi:hypothetical protein
VTALLLAAALATVHGQVLASQRADVLGLPGLERVVLYRLPGRPTHCPRGYVVAVRSGRSTIVRWRFRPRWMTGALCGSEFHWLRVRRLTSARRPEIAFDILLTPSIGEETDVLRAGARRLRRIRVFHADRIALVRRSFVLTWITAARSPDDKRLEVWRWQDGAFRLGRSR